MAALGIIATAAIAIVNIVTTNRRERKLLERTIEAERAAPYREQAVDLVAHARNATSEVRKILNAPLPTTVQEVTAFIESYDAATRATVWADQSAARLSSLGWSQAVRTEAQNLYDLLLSLFLAVAFPRSLIDGPLAALPEAAAIAAGDPTFWRGWHDDLAADVDVVDQAIRDYLAVIGD
jgi:hypothetical protein